MDQRAMKVADEVWVATALLQLENPDRRDFSVKEIRARAAQEPWGKNLRTGFMQHASYHCLANKAPNNVNHRMLFETERGRRRLFRIGDTFHSERAAGRIQPNEGDLLPGYRHLLTWYETVYSHQSWPVPSVTVPHQFPPNPLVVDLSPESFENMRSETAFLGPGGTVVLPESLRQEMGLNDGSCLSIYRDKDRIVVLPITEDFIRSLRGSCKAGDSLVEAREREHRDDRY